MEIIRIQNGSFQPSNLKVNLDDIQIIRWVHEDQEGRIYTFTSSDTFWEPIELDRGDEFEFDFSSVDPGLYRYSAQLGNAFLPGIIDTRPDQ